MLRLLCSGPLNACAPCAPCGSASDDQTSHVDWRTVHQGAASQVLEALHRAERHAERHAVRPRTAPRCFEPAEAPGAGVESLLSLAPQQGVRDGQIPMSLQLMLLPCPAPLGAGLPELMHLLRTRQVRHLLTLGEVPVIWLTTMQSMKPCRFRASFNGADFELWKSDPQARGDAWTSTLKMSGQHLHHQLECLQVPAKQPDLLDPAALQLLVQWLRTDVPPGARVAVIAKDHFLHGMTGQLAMTQALLQQEPAVTAHDKQGKLRRHELLTDIATELSWLNPSYVAGKDHLSAVIEAHRAAQMDGGDFTPNRPNKGVERANATPPVRPSAGRASLNRRPSSALPQAVIQELQQLHASRPVDGPAATRSSANGAPQQWDRRLEDPSWSDSDFDSSSS